MIEREVTLSKLLSDADIMLDFIQKKIWLGIYPLFFFFFFFLISTECIFAQLY